PEHQPGGGELPAHPAPGRRAHGVPDLRKGPWQAGVGAGADDRGVYRAGPAAGPDDIRDRRSGDSPVLLLRRSGIQEVRSMGKHSRRSEHMVGRGRMAAGLTEKPPASDSGLGGDAAGGATANQQGVGKAWVVLV